MICDEAKIARATEECLTSMDSLDDAAALVAETEYLSRLQADDHWSHEEIQEIQKWVRVVRRAAD